jgi:hypothetical protein
MARLGVLEYAADFVRGWPNDGALVMNYATVGASSFANGDLVEVTSGGVKAATDNTLYPAIVARGAADTKGTGTGNLYTQTIPNICVFSNYVVRTSKVNATGLVVGAEVGVVGGVWDVAATAKIGVVTEVETGVANADGVTIPAVAVILVK